MGKSSNDLLNKDFPIDRTSLEVKTKTPSNVTFRVFGEQLAKKPDVIHADIEAKYQDKAAGVTFTQGWTTANALKTLVEVDDKVAKGVKIELSSSLTPAAHGAEKAVTARSTLLTATWKQPGIHTRAVLDLFKVRHALPYAPQHALRLSVALALSSVLVPFPLPFAWRCGVRAQGPTFTADTVLGRDGFLVGLEGSYNVSEGRLTRYATALGFSAPEYAVTLHGLASLSTFSASYYHRVSPDVEAGARATWDSKAAVSAVSLEVAAKACVLRREICCALMGGQVPRRRVVRQG